MFPAAAGWVDQAADQLAVSKAARQASFCTSIRRGSRRDQAVMILLALAGQAPGAAASSFGQAVAVIARVGPVRVGAANNGRVAGIAQVVLARAVAVSSDPAHVLVKVAVANN